VDPHKCVDPNRQVVSYPLMIFLLSSSQNCSVSRIPVGCRERCGGVLMMGPRFSTSTVSPLRQRFRFGPRIRMSLVPQQSKTRPTASWRAKHVPVPINPQVSPCVVRPVNSNLRFCISGFLFMVAFRYAAVNRNR